MNFVHCLLLSTQPINRTWSLTCSWMQAWKSANLSTIKKHVFQLWYQYKHMYLIHMKEQSITYVCLKILSPQIKESISWRNIIFHKKIKGLDYEEMYQFRVLMQITKYAIYTKRNENFNFSEVRIRAHMLSYCNSTMIVLKRIGKKGQFILKLKKIIENRLITNAAIQK